ncbi:DMT family transporter [Bacillaceae bacterium IKA-2]|nr:DMT family transporter [Bacillaceae bacterium IKA-2]
MLSKELFEEEAIKLSRIATYSILLSVMFIWGLNVVAIKFLIEYFPPVTMQAFRILVAGIVTIIILYFLRDLRKLTKKECTYIFLAAILGQLGHHAFLALGLVETTATNAALILGLSPIATSILAIAFLHDRLTMLRLLGIGLGFSGVAIVVLQNSGGLGSISRGDIFVFISMISQVFSFIIIKKLSSTLSTKQMTAVMLLVGSVLLLGLSFFVEPQGMTELSKGTVWVWIVFLVSAIFATGLGHILYNTAIHEIGAGQTAVFNNLIPFFALIGAYLFLGEQIILTQILGFMLIVLGVLFGTGYVDSVLIKRKSRVRSS